MDNLEAWTTEWAGGVSGLAMLAFDVRSGTTARHRAVDCLRLLAEDRPETLDKLPDDTVKAEVAWLCAPSWWSLEYLARSSVEHDLVLVPPGGRLSRLAIILDHADRSASEPVPEAARDLEHCLEILLPYASKAPYAPYLADRIPKLVLASRMRGSKRDIQLHPDSAERVVQSLLLRADDVVAGRSTYDQVIGLVKPWASAVDPDSPTARALVSDSRLAKAFSTGRGSLNDVARKASHGPVLSPLDGSSKFTAAELVRAVAPALRASLASAPVPLLGIAPNVAAASPDALNQASAWAGKVYSQHQFRTRDNVGLGITAAVPVSRPASKHVDEYQKR